MRKDDKAATFILMLQRIGIENILILHHNNIGKQTVSHATL